MTFLITCKTEIMCLGLTATIRDIFPHAILRHANSRQKCLRLLRDENIKLMISDGTVAKGPDLATIREIRALQPDIKILMLLDSIKMDHFKLVCLAGEIDRCIRKNAPIGQIHEAILSVLSGAEA